MPTSVKIDTASDSEKANYMELTLHAISSLETTIRILQAKSVDPTLTSDDHWDIVVQIADLNANLAKMDAQLRAFNAGGMAIEPPSDDDVAVADTAADQLAQMTAANNSITDVVNLATKLIGAWKKTQAS
jgi:hypothetical protein